MKFTDKQNPTSPKSNLGTNEKKSQSQSQSQKVGKEKVMNNSTKKVKMM
jgi:hypothetical protein